MLTADVVGLSRSYCARGLSTSIHVYKGLDHAEALAAAHLRRRRQGLGDRPGRRDVAGPGRVQARQVVVGAAVVTGPHLHGDRVEVDGVETGRPQRGVRRQHEGGPRRRRRDDRGERVDQVLQDEGRGHARRGDPRLFERHLGVALDPRGGQLRGPGQRHPEVRVAVVGDPDPEHGEVPVQLRDGLTQLGTRGGGAQPLARA